MLSLGGPLLSPFSWFVGVAAWGGRLGDCACREYWIKQTLKLLKIRNLLLIPTIISNANWLWVWLLFL